MAHSVLHPLHTITRIEVIPIIEVTESIRFIYRQRIFFFLSSTLSLSLLDPRSLFNTFTLKDHISSTVYSICMLIARLTILVPFFLLFRFGTAYDNEESRAIYGVIIEKATAIMMDHWQIIQESYIQWPESAQVPHHDQDPDKDTPDKPKKPYNIHVVLRPSANTVKDKNARRITRYQRSNVDPLDRVEGETIKTRLERIQRELAMEGIEAEIHIQTSEFARCQGYTQLTPSFHPYLYQAPRVPHSIYRTMLAIMFLSVAMIHGLDQLWDFLYVHTLQREVHYHPDLPRKIAATIFVVIAMLMQMTGKVRPVVAPNRNMLGIER